MLTVAVFYSIIEVVMKIPLSSSDNGCVDIFLVSKSLGLGYANDMFLTVTHHIS